MSDGKLTLPFPDIPIMQTVQVSREALFTQADTPLIFTSPLNRWDFPIAIWFRQEVRKIGVGSLSFDAAYFEGNTTNKLITTTSSTVTSPTFIIQQVQTMTFNLGSFPAQVESGGDKDEIQFKKNGTASFEARRLSIYVIYLPYIIGDKS